MMEHEEYGVMDFLGSVQSAAEGFSVLRKQMNTAKTDVGNLKE